MEITDFMDLGSTSAQNATDISIKLSDGLVYRFGSKSGAKLLQNCMLGRMTDPAQQMVVRDTDDAFVLNFSLEKEIWNLDVQISGGMVLRWDLGRNLAKWH